MRISRATKLYAAAIVALIVMVLAQSAEAENRTYKRSIEKYDMPDVSLINQDGSKVRLKSIFQADQVVIVDFIYGTCTTICPVLSAGYANLQRKLVNSSKIRLVSISIDPENDTPKVMKEYLKRYHAKPGWDFLSGSRRDIDSVLKSFESNFRDKMDHKPLTFIYLPAEGKWIRIFGFISSREFIEECRKAGVV